MERRQDWTCPFRPELQYSSSKLLNSFKWPTVTNPCWSSWHLLYIATKASSTTTSTMVSLWLLLGIMTVEVKSSEQRESILDLILQGVAPWLRCCTHCLRHCCKICLLKDNLWYRIYLNVVRAELMQCRMLLTKSQVLCSLWTCKPETCNYCIYVRAAVGAWKIFLFLWWCTWTFNVWCLYGGKNDTTCCEKCCSRSDEYKKQK